MFPLYRLDRSMSASILVLLFVFLATAFAEVLVDKLQPSVSMSFRGYQVVSNYPSFYGVSSIPTEMAQINFTVPASAPQQFTMKMLTKNFCFLEGALAPVGSTYGQPLDQFKCTSNGMSVTFTAADAALTDIDNEIYGSQVTVTKNGISEDTQVTCSYYIVTVDNYCIYDSAKIFFSYTYEEQGNTMSEQVEVQPSYYSHQGIYFESYGHSGGIAVNFYNYADFLTLESKVKNGDTFTLAFDGPITALPVGLLEDGSARIISYEDENVSYGSCVVADNTFTCTWAGISDADTANFDAFVLIDMPKPNSVLGVVVTGLAHTETFYALVANTQPTPAFGPMIQNTIADTPVTFYLPSEDELSAGFYLKFRLGSTDTRVLGRTCVSDGVTYAHISFTEKDYKVTFTAEGVAARNADNTIDCVVVTNLKNLYLNEDDRIAHYRTNLFLATWQHSLPVYNGPVLGAIPLSAASASNYISLDSAYFNQHLDAGKQITVVGAGPASGNITSVDCSSSSHPGPGHLHRGHQDHRLHHASWRHLLCDPRP
jgi:hypothetical protein